MDTINTNNQLETSKSLPPPAITVSERQPDPDEINLLEYFSVLMKNKHWIILSVILGLITGYVLALIKGPTWISEAVIAAKESDVEKTPNLSSFGAFGGIVASQLNIAGNPKLDQIDIILDSKKFLAEIINQYNLLPLIFKVDKAKLYKEYYDTTKNEWYETFQKPNLLKVASDVKSAYLYKEIKKNNTMNLSYRSSDSLFSDTLLSLTLIHLNEYIKREIIKESKTNVSYLEKKLIKTPDPLLREKIQELIAREFEKMMLVSNEAFKIIDPKLTLSKFSEKRIYPLIFSFGLLFLTVVVVIFSHAVSKSNTTPLKHLTNNQ